MLRFDYASDTMQGNVLGNIFKKPSLPAVAIVYAVSTGLMGETWRSRVKRHRTVVRRPGIRSIATCPIR